MFDAIVVGARCGGAPTAMLLARGGYRVLLVDRATFPSDTVSTHFIWPPGVACLKRWGLLERVLATNCPIIRTIGLDLGEFQLTGNPPPIDGVAEMCAPQRTLLDKLLLDAAAEAGAEVREGFTIAGLTSSDGRVTGIRGHAKGGREIAEQARIVIGADGRNSLVARAAGAEEYNVRPILTCVCYAYWRDVAPHIPAIHPLPRRVVISFPSNDGLTVTGVIFPRDQPTTVRSSLERHLLESLGQVANLAEPFRGGARVERIRGMGDLPNFFRKPYGDGWALVGDAGYHKDPILGKAFPTRSVPRNGWRRRCMPDFPMPDRSARHWRNISAFATATLGRCTISAAIWQASKPRHPRCRPCTGCCAATPSSATAISGHWRARCQSLTTMHGRICSGSRPAPPREDKTPTAMRCLDAPPTRSLRLRDDDRIAVIV
jgi:flavin-dependent dehydrogenase